MQDSQHANSPDSITPTKKGRKRRLRTAYGGPVVERVIYMDPVVQTRKAALNSPFYLYRGPDINYPSGPPNWNNPNVMYLVVGLAILAIGIAIGR